MLPRLLRAFATAEILLDSYLPTIWTAAKVRQMSNRCLVMGHSSQRMKGEKKGHVRCVPKSRNEEWEQDAAVSFRKSSAHGNLLASINVCRNPILLETTLQVLDNATMEPVEPHFVLEPGVPVLLKVRRNAARTIEIIRCRRPPRT